MAASNDAARHGNVDVSARSFPPASIFVPRLRRASNAGIVRLTMASSSADQTGLACALGPLQSAIPHLGRVPISGSGRPSTPFTHRGGTIVMPRDGHSTKLAALTRGFIIVYS